MFGKLTILLGLLVPAIGPAAGQPAAAPTPANDRHVFDIFRDGNKIGTETVEINKDGDTTNVKLTTHISVVILFVQAYRFDHSATETWSGGRFVSFKSLTDDNGTKHTVTALADAEKIELTIDGKQSEVASDVIPASLWNKAVLERTMLFDSETGRQLSVKVTDLGDEPLVQNGATIEAHHYKVSGDLNRDLWFDGNNLVRIKLFGSDHSTIVSDLAPESAASR